MHHRLEPCQLIDREGATVGCEAIEAAAFVAVPGDEVGGLLDEAVDDKAVEGAVEGAGSHADDAVAEFSDSSHECVAVELAVEEGQHDVERRSGKRTSFESHTRTMMYQIPIVKS